MWKILSLTLAFAVATEALQAPRSAFGAKQVSAVQGVAQFAAAAAFAAAVATPDM
jgi:hypothetical protein